MARTIEPKRDETEAETIHRQKAPSLAKRVEQTLEGWSVDITDVEDLIAVLVAAPKDCRIVTDKGGVQGDGWSTLIRAEYDKAQNIMELRFR
jgi:hypothetical protein